MKVKCSKCGHVHHVHKRIWATKGIGLTVSRCPKCDWPGFDEVKKDNKKQ